MGQTTHSDISATKWHFVTPELLAFYTEVSSNSAFSALINGAPTSTQVPYDTDFYESSLPEEGCMDDCFGRMLLYNATRNNFRKILYCDMVSNIIYTETSSDDWANDDVIRFQEPTINEPDWFVIDLSSEVPNNATSVLISTEIEEGANALAELQIHPYILYHESIRLINYLQVIGRQTTLMGMVKCIEQRIGICFLNITNAVLYITLVAYTTDV